MLPLISFATLAALAVVLLRLEAARPRLRPVRVRARRRP